MKPASLKDLKAELSAQHPTKVLEICIRMARYKKENKELLTYLLFEAHDEQAYVAKVKELMDEQFLGLNKSTVFLMKKTIRKVLRTANKYSKYSGSKVTEAELLIHFCRKMREKKIPLKPGSVIGNIYLRQIEKLKGIIAHLHEDLQYDYTREIESLL